MTIVVIDSFDAYNGVGTNTGLQAKWAALDGTTGVSMVAGRFGGQALSVTSDGKFFSRSLPSAISAVALGVALKVTLPSSDQANAQIGFRIGSTWQVGLRVTSTGAIQAYRKTSDTAGTLLGASAGGVLASGTWYYFEVAVVFHATTGSVVVRLNGTDEVLNLTNVNTANSGTTCDSIIIGDTSNTSAPNPAPAFDDLYVNDTNTMLGDRRAEVMVPTADTAQSDFVPSTGTDNYALVDEAQVATADYVSGSVVNDTDRYTLGDLSSSPADIDAVQISVFAQKTDAGTREIALQVKSGATTSDGPNYALGASYAKFERILETDPDTAAAWTAAGVNALEAGPKVTV